MRQHHAIGPPRRLDPAQVLRPILELAQEDRLERYAGRWRALCDRAGVGDLFALATGDNVGLDLTAARRARP